MKILALDFSSARRGVAVLEGERVLASVAESSPTGAGAFQVIAKALETAGLEREQIECLAVGLGPGSYTGIRAALSLAQGWALARPVKLLGIGSMDSLAAEARQRGWHGRVNVVVDGQRNEVYLARHEISADEARLIEPLRLVPVDSARAGIGVGEIVVGPEADRWFAGARILFPDAATLGMLAARRRDFAAGETLEPIYLRPINYVKAPPPRVLPVMPGDGK